jgi:hypothetical protein
VNIRSWSYDLYSIASDNMRFFRSPGNPSFVSSPALGLGTSDAESSSGSLCERAEEESPTDDACVSFLAEGLGVI